MDAGAEDPDRVSMIERLLEGPMPWIGMYVAAASLICAVAMAADALHGLCNKKHWFPSKYFSLNATSLTLLAVALKLPVDLTTRMYTTTDRLAKISSLALLSSAMANFLTSLGSMADKDILSNVTALGIMVITVVVNVLIQVVQMHSFLTTRRAFHEEVVIVVLMLLLLVMFISSALMILSTKRYLQTKYREMHKSVLNEDEGRLRVVTRTTSDELRVLIKKHWVIAKTSNPQFVIARSVTCTTSGVLSLFIALVLLEAEIRMATQGLNILHQTNSSYGWSTKCVLLTQTAGVLVASIAPTARWFGVIKCRLSLNEARRNIASAVTVECYWTQKMVDWRQRSLSLQIPNLKSRKLVHALRGHLLNFCICVQYLIVRTSKLVLLISIFATTPFIPCLNYSRKLMRRQNRVSQSVSSRDPEVSASTGDSSELDIRPYVMLLEGEVELPAETLQNICKELDGVILKGMKRKPENLLKLLTKSCSFKGVAEFDSYQVPSLHAQDLPYCWSLPVVTLACIALALPKVDKNRYDFLVSSVAEGLRLMKLVDKTQDRKGCLANIRTAADVVWVKVELYHMWQDEDLCGISVKGKNAVEIVEELCGKAEKTVIEFQRESRDCLMRNPVNWPANVIAADSMYRVTRTILLNYDQEKDDDDDDDDEALFEKICIMIADIVSACLTNLGQAITMKVHRNAIEKRETSVRKAAILLGETEEIIHLLQQREMSKLATGNAKNIEEWRALCRPNIQREDLGGYHESRGNI